jgi:hypothetical protein
VVARGSSAVGAIAIFFAGSACGGDVRVPGDDGAGGSASPADGGSGGEGAGEPAFTVPPGQTFSQTSCTETGPRLFIEIWPTAVDECVPDPSVIDVLVIGIEGWDFTSGSWPLGEKTPHGTAFANDGGGLGKPSVGSVTLAPFGDVPGVLSWEVDGASGTTDLSLCHQALEAPCASAD